MNAMPAIVPDEGRGQSRAAGNGKPAAYLDSGILVALTIGTADMHHDGAVEVCDEVVRDGCRPAASPLAVMETIGVVRRRTAMSHRCKPGRGEDLLAADADMRRAVALALAIINNMKIQGRLTIMRAAGWSPDFVLMQCKMLDTQAAPCQAGGAGPAGTAGSGRTTGSTTRWPGKPERR